MLWLLPLVPLLAAGFFVAYRLSPASAASKRASKAVAALESLDSELKKQRQDIDSSLSQAASNYIQEVQVGRLRSIQLDELKRHASGMRLQALKDVGIRTLADLQGWNEGRLSNVRGVGPKSASAIARVASQLTRASNAVSNPLPTPPFASERDRILLQSIYRDCWFDAHLSEQRKAFDETLQNCETSLLQIRENTRFSRWLRGFGGTEVVKSGIAAAETLCDGLGAYGPADKLSQGLSKGLAECRAVCSNRIEPDVLIKDYQAKQPIYDWLLAKALGYSHLGQRPVAPDLHVSDSAHSSASALSASSPSAVARLGPAVIKGDQGRSEPEVTHVEPDGPEPPAMSVGQIGEPSNVKLLANAAELVQRLNTQNTGRVIHAPTTDVKPSGGGVFEVQDKSPERLITVRVGGGFHPPDREFPLPTAMFPGESEHVRWLRRGEEVHVQGFTIKTGFLFYGEPASGLEHSVIEPSLVAKQSTQAPTEVPNYCSSYAVLPPDLRYRYLEWLSNGAADRADPGFGMLYFLGLERRLLETQKAEDNPAIAEDRAEILQEVSRIGDLFLGTRGAVSYYARTLIEFFSARSLLVSPTTPELPAAWDRSYELPFYLRFGLGCFMRDKQPIPVEWALRWAYVTPTIYLRTPATRCNKEFESAFAYNYRERFGVGLIIPANKTLLKLTYRLTGPFSQQGENELVFKGIPDVRALTAPQESLRQIVDQSTNMIDAYSRFVGRDASKSGTLEALLALPAMLWPTAAQTVFRGFQASFVEPLQAVTCTTVFRGLGISDEISPARITEVARGLQRLCIGFEPDVLVGARRPKQDEPVVLFPLTSAEDLNRSTVPYRNASLTVTLAAIVALADGHASDSELVAVDQMILTWTHLSLDLRTRLQAQYRLQVRQPATLTSLKSKLTCLGVQERMQVASILASLATVDGVVSPAEVKLLEQVYRILELDPQALYSRLHGGVHKEWRSAGALPGANNSAPLLDKVRITELRQETDQVMKLLTPVFADDDPEAPPEHSGIESRETVTTETDVDYSVLPELSLSDRAFLTLLLGKSEWSRAELLRAATEMQIMLDGTLERINEAALDHFGDALVEGDDPIYVQQTVLETTE